MSRPRCYGLPGGFDVVVWLAMWAAGLATLVAGIWIWISGKRGGGLTARRLAIVAALLIAAIAAMTLAQF